MLCQCICVISFLLPHIQLPVCRNHTDRQYHTLYLWNNHCHYAPRVGIELVMLFSWLRSHFHFWVLLCSRLWDLLSTFDIFSSVCSSHCTWCHHAYSSTFAAVSETGNEIFFTYNSNAIFKLQGNNAKFWIHAYPMNPSQICLVLWYPGLMCIIPLLNYHNPFQNGWSQVNLT